MHRVAVFHTFILDEDSWDITLLSSVFGMTGRSIIYVENSTKLCSKPLVLFKLWAGFRLLSKHNKLWVKLELGPGDHCLDVNETTYQFCILGQVSQSFSIGYDPHLHNEENINRYLLELILGLIIANPSKTFGMCMAYNKWYITAMIIINSNL